ncbi:MAG: hypothetical protein U0002_07180 [Thermoanaerobaculia bacterium]
MIAPGVFERQRGAHKFEHLGYGRQGLTWSIKELDRQLQLMLREQSKYPSPELAQAILDLQATISRANQALAAMPTSLTGVTAALASPSCSSICYSATADAYYFTASQGVGAVADASFNSACGYSGDTYAYAYARATLNGTTTTVTQQDTHPGTSVSSHAAATVSGGSITGTPCYSSANSYAQSSALGITYTTSDVNDSICPVPANLTVGISGSSFESFTLANCRTRTWTSTVSGGNGVYSYQWRRDGVLVATTSSYTGSVCYYDDGGFTLTLSVSDSGGVTGSASKFVDVIYQGGGCAAVVCP